MPCLIRESDGAGDSGGSSMLLRINPETDTLETKQGRPEVGWAIRVGSITARSYSNQDWWQTSTITEILEETEEMVRFKTTNSIYVWRE